MNEAEYKNALAQEKAKQLQAIRTYKLMEVYFDHLKKVDFFPHAGQSEPLKLLLTSSVKNFFLLCSRNYGKSTLAGLAGIGIAGLIPNSKCYVILPYRTLAQEIYWDSGFLEKIIPPEWMDGNFRENANKSELRVRLKNNSFLKLDGADNEATTRGYKPTFLVCDEFQDWNEDSWNGMKPNLLAHNAPCLLIGTPPKIENHFTKELATFKTRMDIQKHPNYFYMVRTIYDNPRYTSEAIEELKQSYIDKQEEHVWRREFLAELILGGAFSIFPMFTEFDHVRPHDWIETKLKTEQGLEYYTVLDPSSTRFGVGFYAYNRYTGTIYLYDEILEQDSMKITAQQIKERVLEIERKNNAKNVLRIYDEASALFANELEQENFNLIPTQKKQNQKSNNISLFKDILLRKKFFASENCKMFIQDIKKYHTDDRGKIVKKKDEGVDCTLYMIAETEYTFSLKPLKSKHIDPITEQPYTYLRKDTEEDMGLAMSGRIDSLSFSEDDLWS